MANVKDITQIGKKWARVTPQRTEDYQAGVTQTNQDWATNTAKAQDRYKEGITKAIQRGAWAKSVTKAGTEKWRVKTATKGVMRWGEGVQVAEQDYTAAIAPYIEAIKSATLPPRYPKGDPRNIERVAAIAKLLRNKKESM